MSHLMLLQAAKKISIYLDCQVKERMHESFDDVLQLMQTVQTMFPQWVLLTCPYRHPQLRFITSNCRTIFGYEPEELMKAPHDHALFSKIHQSDIDDLCRCFAFVEHYLKNSDPGKISRLRFCFTYRIRHKSGTYMILHDEKATLMLDDTLSLHYTLFREESDAASFSGVKVDVYEQLQSLKRVSTYKPSSDSLKPSVRENAILQLIKEGLTDKEIADQLAISSNKASKIRQKMYARYCITNSIGVLNKVLYYQ